MPLDRVVVYPGKVEVHKEGMEVGYLKLSDVEWIKFCPDNEFKHIIRVKGVGVVYVKELEFKGVSWIEKIEEGCIRYERPQFDAAARIATQVAARLRDIAILLSRTEVYQAVEYYEQHKGCSEVNTWVTNKVGTKYWYWYLKCPHKTPSSIYLGKNPEGHRKRMKLARALAEVYYRLKKVGLLELADELEHAFFDFEREEVAEGE
jgi:hypothetical protein